MRLYPCSPNSKTFRNIHGVLMHGATYSSCSLYETALDGYSFMDFLATAGLDGYGVDVRGYGASSRPAEMAVSANINAPLVGTEVAMRDFSAAIDHVLNRMKLDKVNVIGMSWGGAVTGAYTCRNGDKVRRLVLIAPQWLNNPNSFNADVEDRLDAWRVVTVPKAKECWIGAAPQDKQHDLIPNGGFEAWVSNTLRDESDPSLLKQQCIRVTNGAIQDSRDYRGHGIAPYQPEEITVPVLLVHGKYIYSPVELHAGSILRRHAESRIAVVTQIY